MNTTTPVISPLRQRMLEDMRMRKLAPKTQIGYIRAVRHFAGYLGRSPDQASAEDLRRYQLHCVDRGISPITLGPPTRWMRPWISDSARWASNGSSTPVRLTRKRMETVDEELIQAGIRFMDKAQADGQPFFAWFATTRMHVFTRVPQQYQEKAREFTSYHDAYGAGMIQHDEQVGMILKRLDAMGIADNTIVIYSTDNGVEHSTFPTAAPPRSARRR